MDRQKLTTAAAPEASSLRHLEADRLIETGQSLKEIAALFPTKPAGYEYFVNRMVERYAVTDSRCAACGVEGEGSRCEFVWCAHINTAKTVLISFLLSAIMLVAHHLYSRTIVFRFATYHRLCSACWRRYRLPALDCGGSRKTPVCGAHHRASAHRSSPGFCLRRPLRRARGHAGGESRDGRRFHPAGAGLSGF